MIALETRDMVNNGALVNPPNSVALHNASDFLMNSPQTEQKVRNLSAAWAQSGSLSGPDGFAKQVFNDSDLLGKIYELNDILYPAPTN